MRGKVTLKRVGGHDPEASPVPRGPAPEAVTVIGPSLAPIFEHAARVLDGHRAELARGMADALRSGDRTRVDAAADAINAECEDLDE